MNAEFKKALLEITGTDPETRLPLLVDRDYQLWQAAQTAQKRKDAEIARGTNDENRSDPPLFVCGRQYAARIIEEQEGEK